MSLLGEGQPNGAPLFDLNDTRIDDDSLREPSRLLAQEYLDIYGFADDALDLLNHPILTETEGTPAEQASYAMAVARHIEQQVLGLVPDLASAYYIGAELPPQMMELFMLFYRIKPEDIVSGEELPLLMQRSAQREQYMAALRYSIRNTLTLGQYKRLQAQLGRAQESID